jgi:cytochrome c
MSKKHLSIALSLLLAIFASTLSAKSYTPRANTRAAIKAYVDRAAKVVASKGADCKAFKSRAWMSGDYYIFVSGPDDRLVCHPNAQMVGKLNTEVVDANGKNIGQALNVAASQPGGGWVDYVWPRPGKTKPEPKSSYVMKVTGPDGKSYEVGSGGYGLK